jgi:peptide/nickel transport system ATP-binding protein
MIFQNPEEALNPYLTIGASLRRPLMLQFGLSRRQADAKIETLLTDVQLPADYIGRMPGQLSGGEKQRIAILRAFETQPDLLIADEPVSSLDVSVQAAILNLLNHLQGELHSSMLFISHDLAVVGYLADEIAVVYLGHLVELAPADALFKPPYHPYTEALLSAIPSIQPGQGSKIIHLEGDIPSPSEIPSGCPFHTRCIHNIGVICASQPPPWRQDERTNKRFSCHLTVAELHTLQDPEGSFS